MKTGRDNVVLHRTNIATNGIVNLLSFSKLLQLGSKPCSWGATLGYPSALFPSTGSNLFLLALQLLLLLFRCSLLPLMLISLSDGVFRDLFFRLKRLNVADNRAVVCADVMFNIVKPMIPDSALVSFAAKHDIKKIFASDGTVKWYGCRRGLSYTKGKSCSWPNGMGAPPCDLWNLGEVVRVVMQECEKGGMHCEYAAGNVLGRKYESFLAPCS